MWNWEQITMDFITKLPKTTKVFDVIWVIMDRMTKSGHFLDIRESSSLHKLVDEYVHEIVIRHGVQVSIVVLVCCLTNFSSGGSYVH